MPPTVPEPISEDARPRGVPITSALGFTDVQVRARPDRCLSFLSVHADGPETAALTRALGRARRAGPGAAAITKRRLRRAIAELEADDPTSAALATWRDVATWHWGSRGRRSGRATVVLDPDPRAPADHPHVLALRAVVASGRHIVPPHSMKLIDVGPRHPFLGQWQQRWSSLPGQYERWPASLRLWSIPGGAYPDTDADYAAVLDDHVALLADLLDGAEPLFAVVVDLSPSPHPSDAVMTDEAIPGLTPFVSWAWTESTPYLFVAHAYVTEVALDARALAPLIGDPDRMPATAADALAVILTPPDLRWQYRPYDAGVDILLPDREAVIALARTHADRLPWGHELGDPAAYLLAATRAVLVGNGTDTADDVGRLKRHCRREHLRFVALEPHRDPTDALRAALASVSMNPEEAVLVTWSPGEAAAAVAAGVRVIGCGADDAGRRAIAEAGAGTVVERITDVLPGP